MNITEEKISISIKQKEFSANELINKLAHTVENLINDIQELKEENKELKKFKIKMEEKEKRKYGIENSSIIKNEEQIKMISDWIAPNKKIIFTRIYRATKDGGIGYNFHKHCDNQGPTLTLIESTKGHIFGGYITISWESPTSSTYKGNDDKAFIFSVNNKLKYPIQDKSKVIYNRQDYGPVFGNYEIYISKDIFSINDNNYGSSCNENNSYKLSPEKIAGGSSFYVSELEVYRIQLV